MFGKYILGYTIIRIMRLALLILSPSNTRLRTADFFSSSWSCVPPDFVRVYGGLSVSVFDPNNVLVIRLLPHLFILSFVGSQDQTVDSVFEKYARPSTIDDCHRPRPGRETGRGRDHVYTVTAIFAVHCEGRGKS